RAEERLSFDIQREIAVRLGYTEHPGLKDVERFMKHYFLVAKDVGDLTAILCAGLEARQAKPAPVLSRVMARLRPLGRRARNESVVLGPFIPNFGRIVTMMQFNMYHHYTVDQHLLRCIGVLAEIERGGNEQFALAGELMRTIQPAHRAVLYVALFLHDIAKGRVEDHSLAGARIARRFCPRLGLSPAETETVAWQIGRASGRE